jgi:ribosomal protein S18 acetylase RimI-like enzyme
MTDPNSIEVRPARRSDARALGEFLARVGEPLAATDAMRENRIVAVGGGDILGACHFLASPGRCAVVLAPRLPEWDTALAARLLRAAAARVSVRDGARLIQVLTEPDGSQPLVAALEQAGFERLSVLAYLRRAVEPGERDLKLPPELRWRKYWRLRHGQFARTIAATYADSLDCPRLAGLRTVDDAVATHKHTGIFSPRSWSLALRGGEPVGVVLVNNLQGRGDVVYLGVVPGARRRGIGRALVMRAARDTAEMGLPQMGLAVDVSNVPAMWLYEKEGFREIRRRVAYFIPAAGLEAIGGL